MHPQLAELTQILEEGGIRYWVDSGTLIGLMREGDVLPYDKDIDLGIWIDEVAETLAIAPMFQAAGYEVDCGVYRKMRYNIRLRPEHKNGMHANIGVYRRDKGKAWRMALFVPGNPHPPGSLRFLLQGCWRFPMRYATLAARNMFGRDRILGRWPWRHILKTGVWVVPARHFDGTETHETGLPIPLDAENYLDYRYGDWREPVKDWIWYRDDRAVHQELPERLVAVP